MNKFKKEAVAHYDRWKLYRIKIDKSKDNLCNIRGREGDIIRR